MKKLVMTVLATMVLLPLAQREANAGNIMGHACIPNTSSDFAILDYSTTYGPYNTNLSNTANVSCALENSFNKVNGFGVFYYNRNATTPLSCTAYILGPDGTPVWSQTATAPGISLSVQVFAMTPPSAMTGKAFLKCSIPPHVTTGGQNSHVTYVFSSGVN